MKKESTMIILSDDIIFRKAVIHLLNVELGKFAPAQDLFMMQPDVIELVRKQVCYLLNSDKHFLLKDKFVNIIIKLMCYYHVSIQLDDWIDRPSLQILEDAINTIMNNHSGWLNILLPDETVLVVFEWDNLNLTVYNPSKEIQALMQKIACSEGLFWRKSDMI